MKKLPFLESPLPRWERGLGWGKHRDRPGFHSSGDRRSWATRFCLPGKRFGVARRDQARSRASRDGTTGRRCAAAPGTGAGTTADEQRRIFDVFYGLGDELHHHTSKFEFKGSGLGIGRSIALEIARAHRGGIELVSQPGEGSTLTLWVSVG
ncbi:MAG: sensor histidine kinase [Deferrisomatales bacterium]